jgi:hypothetical protein
MTFAWPAALAFLAGVPLVLGFYLAVLARRRRRAVTY